MRTPHRIVPLLAAALFLGLAPRSGAESAPRERILMDPGWRFHMGDDLGDGLGLAKAGSSYGPASADFGDSSWRGVDLPHDWAIELAFDPKADASHGFRPVGEGFRENSIGWYRKSFELPKEDAGRRLWLEFDGVYRHCSVFVNGWLVERHDGGYNGFRCDITDVANCGGRNVVAVRVDASHFEGWFYEGAGIYRHVWLVKTEPLAVAPDGVFVSGRFAGNVPGPAADVVMQARLLNSAGRAADARVDWEVTAPGGEVVATAQAPAEVGAMAHADVERTVQVRGPVLWSPETPALYTLVTTVSAGGRTVDRVETRFGIRTVAFDADRGFILNGRPYTLKGTSNHQDHAGVGSALPDAIQSFRIARLKEMGCNAYRTAHNPPTPELLDACDRLGMLVMDENRILGSDELRMGYLEEQVRRDRNHASVALWSLGNEEFEVQTTPSGGRVAATMQAFVRGLDPTRPITINADLGNQYAGVDEVIEVRGWSYHVGQAMDDYHREHPLQPNVGSEQGSTVGTRGIYADDKQRGYVSAYDDFAPEWAQTAETWMGFFATRPWLSGGFVWTGLDYRGEPTPYGWPCINSHFGILDTCGFPKDNFWYYKAWWGADTVLHLMPHWNWPGREGQAIDVRALTNCEEVELFLNGRSLGRKPVKPYLTVGWKVPYEAGTLSARGYKGGQLAAETAVETTGAPAAVALKPDRAVIDADGRDAAVYTVSVVDERGRTVPTASNLVAFELEGPGRILGVGNGDPSCHEPDKYFGEPVLRSVPLAGWRIHPVENPYKADLAEEAAQFDDSAWAAVDTSGPSGTLGFHDKAVYRARFSVSEQDLASPGAQIVFRRIAGGIAVYVNGTKVGGTADPRVVCQYDVKGVLHAGENTVAVTAANYGNDPYGISGGVSLVWVGDAPAPRWSRSVFNGLAEVIVQSSGGPGQIRLTARADGLGEASSPVESRRPSP